MISRTRVLFLLIALTTLFLSGCAAASPAAVPTAASADDNAAREDETMPAPTSPGAEETAAGAGADAGAAARPTEAPILEPTSTPIAVDWTVTAGVDGDYYILGNPSAPIRLVDFSDFLRGACGSHVLRVEPEILANEVAAGTVSLAFHHVLDHGDRSNLAHRSVECAGAQDPLAFWAMHNRLFALQNEFWMDGDAIIARITDELGLNADAMQACLADPAINDKVVRMDQERRDRGVRLRPSFDINGRLIEGSVPYPVFQQFFAEELAQ